MPSNNNSVGMQLKMKPQWNFLTNFISLHYYFTPEGQFETNVGQNSQCVKLAFIFSQQAK